MTDEVEWSNPRDGAEQQPASVLPLKIVAGGAAVTVGFVVAPFLSPLGGAVATAALTPAFEQLAVLGQRRIDRVIQEGAGAAGMSRDEVCIWASASDQHLSYLGSVAEAAMRGQDERKLRALARLLAEGLGDDARLEVAPLVVAALNRLEAPHIRTLERMVEEANAGDDFRGTVRLEDEAGLEPPVGESREWTVGDLASDMPHLGDGMDSIVATLDSVGCIAPGQARVPILAHTDQGRPGTHWVVTPFGRLCLSYLREYVPHDDA